LVAAKNVWHIKKKKIQLTFGLFSDKGMGPYYSAYAGGLAKVIAWSQFDCLFLIQKLSNAKCTECNKLWHEYA